MLKDKAQFEGTGMRNDNIKVGIKVIWRYLTQ
jgi:hypothetical protein